MKIRPAFTTLKILCYNILLHRFVTFKMKQILLNFFFGVVALALVFSSSVSFSKRHHHENCDLVSVTTNSREKKERMCALIHLLCKKEKEFSF
jgi:hypothetical protein